MAIPNRLTTVRSLRDYKRQNQAMANRTNPTQPDAGSARSPRGRRAALAQQKIWINHLYGVGLSTSDIAARLDVAEQTVRDWYNKLTLATPANMSALAALSNTHALLAEQAEYLKGLLARGWTRASIGEALKCKPDNITLWLEGGVVARTTIRAKLKELHDSGDAPPKVTRRALFHGPLSREERERRDRLEYEYGLYPPTERKKTIRGLARRYKLTLKDLARLLNVDHKTLIKYTNRKHKMHMSPDIVDRLVDIIKMDRIDYPLESPGKCFQRLAQKIFGPYYKKGYEKRSPERVKALDILEALTTYHRWSLYRYIPPFPRKNERPPQLLLEQLEAVADLIERDKHLLTSKRIQAALKGKANGDTDHSAGRQTARKTA